LDFLQVLGIEENLVIVERHTHSPESLQESVGRWARQLEIESVENVLLHLQNSLFCEFVFTHGKEVSELWWIDFFILGSQEQGGDTEQMELVLLDLLLAHELIDDVDGHVQAFWSQSEFSVDIDDPFNQKGPRGILNFCLDFLEIIWVYHLLHLVLEHGLVNITRELREYLWIAVVKLVTQWKSLHLLSFVFLFSLSENLSNRFLLSVSSDEF